jgi:hypothetical protein
LNDHRDMFLKLAREWDALADSLEKRMRENVGPAAQPKTTRPLNGGGPRRIFAPGNGTYRKFL